MTTNEILDATVVIDGYDTTIRKYLHRLLTTMWDEGEGFSGKRPFGNSGWEFDLYSALVQLKAVDGKFDEDGYLEWVDENQCDYAVFELIDCMCGCTRD